MKVHRRVKLRLLKQIRELRNSLEIVEPDGDAAASTSGCCGKQAFDTEHEALSAISNRRMNSNRPHRAYLCPMGKWHLTSMTKKTFEMVMGSIK